MEDERGDRRVSIRLAMLAGDDALDDFSCLPLTRAQSIFLGYVQGLAKVLEQSPLGLSLFQSAIKSGVSVGLDPLLEPRGCFFYPAQNHFDLGHQPQALQATEKGMSRSLASFICGLRRAWHLYRGAEQDTRLTPDDFMRQSRFLEADAEAVTHLVAWELRSAGAPFFWRYLLSAHNGDVSVIFERAILENPYHQFDGTALKAAFNQWFADAERMAMCDHGALEAMDAALSRFMEEYAQREAHEMPGQRRLLRSAAQDIGRLPNGVNYLHECPFGSPWYGRVDDDINRLHLRHLRQDITQVIDNNKYISEVFI